MSGVADDVVSEDRGGPSDDGRSRVVSMRTRRRFTGAIGSEEAHDGAAANVVDRRFRGQRLCRRTWRSDGLRLRAAWVR